MAHLEFESEGGRAADTARAPDAVRAAELRADVARLLLVANWGLVLWCGTIVMDLTVRVAIQHASPWKIVSLRVLGAILIVASTRFVARPAITRSQLAWARGGMFAMIAVMMGLQCAADRGMDSPLLFTLIAIATVQASTAPMPLWPGLVRLLAVALLGIGTAAIASSIADASLVTFFVEVMTVLGSVVLAAIGGAAYWRLRRQVFARRLVGRYRLIARIGQGGMGEVWRARHPGLRRDVAVKILRSDRATADQIARFEAEIAALAELSHPNIVRVYDSGVTDDGLCYYAMELLRGETLEARVKRAGPLDAETATSVMRQIGRALAEAHDRGIIHRDLTPRNVFLDASLGMEHAKLIDFGIAARTTEISGSDLVVAGTPAYMAPEQARGEPVTPAADLYALGAVWYFALTGKLVAAEPPSAHAAAIPPVVDAIVMRCLDADPAKRFADARAIDMACGGPVALAELPIALDPQARSSDEAHTPMVIEDGETRAAQVRIRTILTWGLVVWAAMGATDIAISREPGTLGLPYFFAVRATSVAVVLACLVALRTNRFALVQTLAFSVLAVACGLLAAGGTGLQSPTVGTLMFVMVAQGLAMPDRMLPTFRRLGITVVLFTITLNVGVAVRDIPRDLGMYFQYGMTSVGTLLLMANVGKAYWSLRQQLFEQRVVGRYRLGRMLGAGGMGQVWTADHPGLGREVAVKLLRPTDASPEMVARFETEIQALTELVSPHTVRVYDCGSTDDGYFFYVMERLQGSTVTHAVRTEGVFDGKRTIRVARQIAIALAEAHAAGIIHRDLKPDNLFLTTVGDDRDFVKLLDFGVAKRTMANRFTQTGVAVGTPAFMAPEQAMSETVDGRTDVYALGAVMFHMLAGRPPFTAESNAILMLSQVHDETPRPSAFAIGVPEALDDLVDRCLAKHPDDRPASMLELERELAAIERDFEDLPLARTTSVATPVISAEAATIAARKPPHDDTPGR